MAVAFVGGGCGTSARLSLGDDDAPVAYVAETWMLVRPWTPDKSEKSRAAAGSTASRRNVVMVIVTVRGRLESATDLKFRETLALRPSYRFTFACLLCVR